MTLDRLTVRELLSSLGSRSPTPGGGAAAALTAALAAAMGEMVVNLSRGKPALAAHDDLYAEALRGLAELRGGALDLAQADAEAYGRLSALFRLDRGEERREREWDEAENAAIAAPRRVMDTCLEILDLLQRLLGASNPNLGSDLAVAAVLAEAGCRAAAWNVRANLPLLRDPQGALRIGSEADALIDRARAISGQIEGKLS